MPKHNVRRHAVEQPQDQGIKLIPLTRGQNAIVDAADYEWLAFGWGFSWNAHLKHNTVGIYYVMDSRGVQMHRAILGVTDPKIVVDHINRNTLDNRRSNLRAATNSQNVMNGKVRVHNKLGIKGVYQRVDKFRACIRINGKTQNLGTFNTAEEAHAAYCAKATECYGEYARFA